jgi:hypothetical protein
MKIFFATLSIILFSVSPGICQNSSNTKPTLENTQEWLKSKIESHGVGRYPAVSYKVDFNKDCIMTIKEMSFDGMVLATFDLEYKSIDFEKVTMRINKIDTMIIKLGAVEMRFTNDEKNDFYNRLIKALKNCKELCEGAPDDLF